MDFLSSRAFESDARLRAGAGPLLALVLVGLLGDVARPEEAYAGIDYGLSLLAFLGATGGVACLTSRLAAGLDPLPWAGTVGPAAPGRKARRIRERRRRRGDSREPCAPFRKNLP